MKTVTLSIIAMAVILVVGIVIILAITTNPIKSNIKITIEGLDETYHVGEEFRFYVKVNGYGKFCGDPYVVISTATNPPEIVWSYSGQEFIGVCPPRDIQYTFGTKFVSINQTGSYEVSVPFGDNVIRKEFTVIPSEQESTGTANIKNQTYYFTTVDDIMTTYRGEGVQIPFHNVTFTLLPYPFSGGPVGSCGGFNFESSVKFSDSTHELLGIFVPAMPCLKNYTQADFSNHTNPQAGLAVYDEKVKLLVSIANLGLYHMIATNSDYNLQITVDHATTDNNTESYKVTVKNIGKTKVQIDSVHLGGTLCLPPTCSGGSIVMDYRMVGVDSSVPMNPVYETLQLDPGQTANSTATGWWPLAQRFSAIADYLVVSDKSWLEHKFSIATSWNNTGAMQSFAGTNILYYHIYENMPEPKVYVYKSLSTDQITEAIDTARNSIQSIYPSSLEEAFEYSPDARIMIRDISTSITATEFVKPHAGYIFVLVPEKLTQEQLDIISKSLVSYSFELIGYYTADERAKDEDSNVKVHLDYHKINGLDNVTISVTNIGSKPVIIEEANIGVENIFEQNGSGQTSSSFKGIYELISSDNSIPKPLYTSPLRLEAGQIIKGFIDGNYSDWHYFVGSVIYEPDEQVIVTHRVSSEITR